MTRRTTTMIIPSPSTTTMSSSSASTVSSSLSSTTQRRRCVQVAMFLLLVRNIGLGDAFTPTPAKGVVSPHHFIPQRVVASPSSVAKVMKTTTTSLKIVQRPGAGDDHHHLHHQLPNHKHITSHKNNHRKKTAKAGVIGATSSRTGRRKTQEDQGLSMSTMSSVATTGGSSSSNGSGGRLMTTPEFMQHPLDRNIQLLSDLFYTQNNISKGTKIHLINGITSLLVLSKFMLMTGRRTCSCLSSIALLYGFIGLAFDNIVNAAGKYVGKGRKLRLLTKCRLIFHGTGVPLLTIPIIEAAFFQGLLCAKVASKLLLFCTSFSLYELINWLMYDSNRLQVVDNTDSSEHSVRYLAGTLTYTSGKVLQCVLPAAILSLSQVTIGSLLFKKSWAGVWLLTSGLVSFISCAIPKRPDVQLYGETASVGLLWATAACVL